MKEIPAAGVMNSAVGIIFYLKSEAKDGTDKPVPDLSGFRAAMPVPHRHALRTMDAALTHRLALAYMSGSKPAARLQNHLYTQKEHG